MFRILLSLLLATFAFTSLAADDRPNFIFIIADDQAWDDSGAYGNPKVRTPNIDRLAGQGMRFDNAFLTIASCSASRSSIITGRYPHNTDAEQLHWPLPGRHLTFVELLKHSGYYTAAAGKWHLGEEVKDRFDHVVEADVSGFQMPSGADQNKGKFIQRMSGDARSGCDQWIPTLRGRPRDKPFFLWLAALDPHRPYDENIIPNPHKPEDVIVPPYLPDIPEVRKDLALYYDEITRLDSFVGLVMQELAAQGAAENTVVLYISDNGRPFPRAKITLYDSGIRTPWIVRWPAGVKAGSVTSRLVSSVDIAPTFLELAGIPSSSLFQGRSFAKILSNPSAKIRDYVYAEKHWHDYDDQCRAVRSERFKYIRNFYPDLPATPSADGVRSPTYRRTLALRGEGKLTPPQQNIFLAPRPTEELYDCQTDPHEIVNLANDPRHASTLKKLRRALDSWQRDTNDSIPTKRTPDEFDRSTGLATPARIRPRPSKALMQARGIIE
jgi:N-sulfoglucosamine sulfohydrolase